MTIDDYWDVIEAAHGDPARIRAALTKLPADEIYSWLEHQAALMVASYSWELWGAAYIANGGCSDDGFDYFRGWLMAQGRRAWERVLADPDALAELVGGDQDHECADLIFIGAQAYEEVTGQYPNGPKIRLPNLGDSWDFDDGDDMRRRYPRLTQALCD
jgi:hypothetical protein